MTSTQTLRPIRCSTRDHVAIAEALDNLRPFTTSGALHGEPHALVWSQSCGRLPAAEARRFMDRAETIDYVVYSYVTPIAWHDAETGWTVPNVKYSPTTSHHQSTIRAAVGAQVG